MKAMINGIELEGTPDELREYFGTQNASEAGAEVKVVATEEVTDWLEELLMSLTTSQRQTYRIFRDARQANPDSRTGVHISYIAEKLEISHPAASQRCRTLLKLGLIEKTSKATYRRT